MKLPLPLITCLCLLASGLSHAGVPVIVKPEVRMEEIAKAPAKWENKSVRVAGAVESIAPSKTKGPDGEPRHEGKVGSLRVIFSKEAHAYHLASLKVLRLAVYQGEVKQAADTGKPALFLSKGLNHAR